MHTDPGMVFDELLALPTKSPLLEEIIAKFLKVVKILLTIIISCLSVIPIIITSFLDGALVLHKVRVCILHEATIYIL
jgi:hypothetical protein